jgi:hypothetical protein
MFDCAPKLFKLKRNVSVEESLASKLSFGGCRVTSHGHAALFYLVFFSDAVRRNALTKDSTEKEIELLLITRWLQPLIGMVAEARGRTGRQHRPQKCSGIKCFKVTNLILEISILNSLILH